MSILLIVTRVGSVSLTVHRSEKKDLNSMDKNKSFGGYLRLPVGQFPGIPVLIQDRNQGWSWAKLHDLVKK
jgi:hypothetical protein